MSTDHRQQTHERAKVAQADGELQGMILLMAILLLMVPLVALFTS